MGKYTLQDYIDAQQGGEWYIGKSMWSREEHFRILQYQCVADILFWDITRRQVDTENNTIMHRDMQSEHAALQIRQVSMRHGMLRLI